MDFAFEMLKEKGEPKEKLACNGLEVVETSCQAMRRGKVFIGLWGHC
jgi:hypothetical protein